MKIQTTDIPDLLIIEPKIFSDSRGYFFESWSANNYGEVGITNNFIQDNESKSSYGVLRGFHFQAYPYTQAKLVRVIQGRVLDIAIDIRKNSPTFGKHFAIELSGGNKLQLFIPRGFAHGFAVLSEEVTFTYKCDNTYMPSHERGISLKSPEFNIDWQIPEDKWILSPKDLKNPLFSESEYLEHEL